MKATARCAARVAFACSLAACTPITASRKFVPDMPGMTVEAPGENGTPAARHVVPPDAVDDRSAVLVFSRGARLVEAHEGGKLRTAEIRVHFRARNDEQIPLVMEAHNALVVIGPERRDPEVLSPAWIEVNEEEHATDAGSIVLPPHSTSSWEIVFTVPARRDPLAEVRSFLVSWTYRLRDTPYEEKTRFVAPLRYGNGWAAAQLSPTGGTL